MRPVDAALAMADSIAERIGWWRWQSWMRIPASQAVVVLSGVAVGGVGGVRPALKPTGLPRRGMWRKYPGRHE
jgi:hypothetical protein